MKDDFQIERQYDYKPRGSTLVAGVLLFSLFGAACFLVAATNERSQIIRRTNIELSPTQVRIVWGILGGFCFGFVAFALWSERFSRRLSLRIVFTPAAIILPQTQFSSKEIAVEYGSITAVDSWKGRYGLRSLTFSYKGGQFRIDNSMLPSEEDFDDIKFALNERVASVASTGTGSAGPGRISVLADYPIKDRVPGWFFRVREQGAGFFRAEGINIWGRQVSVKGADRDALLEKCLAAARCASAGNWEDESIADARKFPRIPTDKLIGLGLTKANGDDLAFVAFDESMGQSYLDYILEWRDAGEPFFPPDRIEKVEKDWPGFALQRLDSAAGRNLPDGAVPQTTFFLLRGQRIVADSDLRPRLNDFFKIIGGHIGYGVRPSERGKGYATLILRLTLEKARAFGLSRVLLTCEKDNVASARVIVKNGGVLRDEVISPRSGKPSQRYWIDLKAG